MRSSLRGSIVGSGGTLVVAVVMGLAFGSDNVVSVATN